MNIDTKQHSLKHVKIELSGRFDAHEAPAFAELVNDELAKGTTMIDVDLSAVVFVDSTALAGLTTGMKRCRERGGDLVIVSPSDPVKVILELTRLDQAFVIR